MKKATKRRFLRNETLEESKLRIEKAIKNMGNSNISISEDDFRKLSKGLSFIK